MIKPNIVSTSIAIGTGLLGTAVGVVLFLPSAMSFDAGLNVKPSMALLGYSGMSVIPVTVVATALTILTGDLGFQSLYVLPAGGIVTAIIWDGIISKPEMSTINALPPVTI
jgi:hypothetical protein